MPYINESIQTQFRTIEETRQYIRAFDRVAETTTTARELYDQMLSLYPDRVNLGALWASARALKPEEGKTACTL